MDKTQADQKMSNNSAAKVNGEAVVAVIQPASSGGQPLYHVIM